MRYLIACLMICSVLYANQNTRVPPKNPPPPEVQPQPWFTGPLIAPPGTAIPWGDFEIQAYTFATTDTAVYDKHWNAVSIPKFISINSVVYTFWGITSWADIQIAPQTFAQFVENRSSFQFGDLPIGFDFQLYPEDNPQWYPGVKLSITEIFPTGKFQRLDPNKLFTDHSGQGAFGTNINLVLYKIYHLTGVHFLSLTLAGEFTFNSIVKVHGLNAYGGGYDTRGKVHPGTIIQGIFSFEIMLSQNWAFAMDTVYTHTNRSKFTGYPGRALFRPDSPPAIIGLPSQEQLSFTPSIEYNFSANFGIIVGAWVTAAGRFASKFQSGVINIDYTY